MEIPFREETMFMLLDIEERIPWNSMDSMELHGIHGIPWNPCIPWNSMETMEFYGFHGISWNPWNFMDSCFDKLECEFSIC